MIFKSACFSAFALACCVSMVGCQTGNSIWNKPAYSPAPAGNAARTYTPTQTVSPYQTQQGYGQAQQGYGQQSYGGSGSSGGSGGR